MSEGHPTSLWLAAGSNSSASHKCEIRPESFDAACTNSWLSAFRAASTETQSGEPLVCGHLTRSPQRPIRSVYLVGMKRWTSTATWSDVGCRDKMPSGTQHVSANDHSVVDLFFDLLVGQAVGALSDPPLGRVVILGLNRTQPGHDLAHRCQVGLDEPLVD